MSWADTSALVRIYLQVQPNSEDFCGPATLAGSGKFDATVPSSPTVVVQIVPISVQPALTYNRPKSVNDYSVVEELKKAIFELKVENDFLKTKLRSLALCSRCSQPLTQSNPAQNGDDPSDRRSNTPESDPTSSDPEDPNDEELDELTLRCRQMSLGPMTPYLGPASSLALAGNVLVAFGSTHINTKFSALLILGYIAGESFEQTRNPPPTGVFQWEKEVYDQRPHYVFPASDLIKSLLDHYFSKIHPTIPILHRPSFELSVAKGLHLTDSDFGGTLLSVLALASRYSNDPRVFVDRNVSLSSGWMFASQVRILPKLFQPTIYEVQMYCLLTLFALGTSGPQISWFYIGLGIRCLQQRGDYRRNSGDSESIHELWKRAFWSFVALERKLCFCMGRPPTLHPEEYSVETPLEVDDVYWDRGFVQPIGKPSELSYFVFHLRLCEILGDAMRRLYGSKKSKIRMGWDGPQWEQHIVAELDSAMNDFLDSIPPHLRWDSENPPQGKFFEQCAVLHMTYNYVRISIHRRYVQRTTVGGVPSLSVCASAARAIIRTADIWLSKLQRVPLPHIIDAVFSSGIILVLNVLQTKRAGISMGKNKDLLLVARAMDIFKFAESRLQPVGRVYELLRELWIIGNSPNADVVPSPAGLSPSNGDHPQLGQSFDFSNSPASSDQTPALRPGMSIEELLADSDPLNAILDDELMSMLMGTYTDVANIDHWDAYMENRNSYSDTDPNWSNTFRT
ncbi:fungal-specific transcription factor domain-containing protein [Mycena olivaceomarginata]|nr:fungal-specific transcription factor domain-containing protein [Mycena olivaceomarginata]